MKLIIILFSSLFLNTLYAQDIIINEVSSGDDLLELHNTTNSAIDLEGYYLSDDSEDLTQWQIYQLNPTNSNPSGSIIEAQGFIIIRCLGTTTASTRHFNANFKLSGDGETVYLSNPSGVVIDTLEFPTLPLTHSYGRLSDGSLAYFEENSLGDTRNPSLPNVDSDSYNRDLDLEIPEISAPYEVFNGSVNVELIPSTDTPIYYTLDGSNPDVNSPVYNGMFTVSNTTVVKCAHANAQGIIGRPAMRTFLFNVDHTIPIVNITTEHYEDRVKVGNFFDAPTMDGRVKVDFFESDGEIAFEEYATYERSGGGGSSGGYQINGKIGISDESSSDHFNNHFYPNKPAIEKIEKFLISNASQDQYRAHIRDVFFARVVSEDELIDFGFEDSRPVVTYVNGVYEGVLQIKEDDDKYFVEQNFPDQDPENELLQLNDFSDSQNVDEIDTIIGLENLYFFAWHTFFIGGFEHDVNVLTFADGSHYAASHDDDISFGIFETAQVQPMTSTVTFDAENIDFGIQNYIPSSLHNKMFQSWCSYANFLYDPARTTPIINEMEAELEPEMTLHTAYMQNVLTINPELANRGPVSTTLTEWKNEIDIIRQTLQIRTTGFFDKLQTDYGLTDMVELTASTNDKSQGSVAIEGVKLRDQTMSGPFFSEVDIHLKAVAETGYRFVEWQGLSNSTDEEITIKLSNAGSIEAFFEPIPITEVALSINEVQPKNDTTYADEFGEFNDWVEIYNSGTTDVDLAGFYLSDNPDITNKYQVVSGDPEKTTVPAGGYLVLWLDNDTEQGANHLGFKLSTEDEILLVNVDGLTVIDSLSFDLNTDESYGASSDGDNSNLEVFTTPTPNATNNVEEISIIWTGTTNNDWNTVTNWNTNTIPTSSTVVIIPSGLTNYPTLNNEVTVNTLTINTGATLLTNGFNITGEVTYKSNLPTTDWYLVSSPVTGETIQNIISNHSLATGTVSSTNLGLAPYNNNSTPRWEYQNNSSTGTLNSGEGYSIKLDTAGDVSFTGTATTFNVNTLVTMGTADDYNLIGNPFTGYIESNIFVEGNTNINNNTIYLWNGSQYVTYNDVSPIDIAPAQSFFIEATADAAITFDVTKQKHNSSNTSPKQKSTSNFELSVTSNGKSNVTKVFYVAGKTTGFDFGYDSKIFDGITTDFAIYTDLVTESTGVKLAIQTLPTDSTEVIPVGLIAEAGQEITFSLENFNLPENTFVYLEDKVTGKFINLFEDDYKTTLENEADGIGQFYIHTSAKSLSTNDSIANIANVNVYKSSSNQVTVTGLNADATVSIFSLAAKQVINTSIKASNVNTINLSRLSTGIYIIKILSVNGTTTKKIILD